MDERQNDRKQTESQEKSHDYDIVNDFKVGHAGVPKFLKFTFAFLAAWAFYYSITASSVNDRVEGGQTQPASAQAGADIFSTSCAGCHNITGERKVGPGLKGVHQRLGDKELDNVIHNGRPPKGMPAPPSLGLNETQLQSLKLYLETLK